MPEAVTLPDNSARPPAPKGAPSPGAPRKAVRIPHAPGLDGLRGAAVAAVVVFHAAPLTWLPGGFLGVSLFFTLSGYLITTLVLAEVRRDRGISLDSFWSRRFRRLLPALLVTTVGVLVASQFTDLGAHVRADLLGGLTYSSNWVLIARGQSYADLFVAPSPLTHLWSLAIEEQFYVILPLAAWLMGRRAPWLVRRDLTIAAGLVVVAGVAACQITDDPILAYYGTLHRAPEIAIGVLLATLTAPTRARTSQRLDIAGGIAIVITLFAWRFAGDQQGWIAQGGLAAFAVVSAVLVRCAARPGPISTGLSIAPLRGLGLISYGLYLFHWPIVVLVDPYRMKTSGWPVISTIHWSPVALFVVRVGLSLLLAVASYRFIEQPIRRGRLDTPPRLVLLWGAAALITGIIAVLVFAPAGQAETAAKPAPAIVDPTAKLTAPKDPTVAAPPRMVFVGDSLPAWMIRDGGSVLDPKQITVVNGTLEACDGAEGKVVARSRLGIEVPVPAGCTGWKTQYPPFFTHRADLAVLMVGGHAALDRKINGQFEAPCSPAASNWYGNDVVQRLRYMRKHADHVVLVLPAWADDRAEWIYPNDHRDRMDCVRLTLTSAAERAGADTIDFGGYLCPDGRYQCRPLRQKDGMHLDPANAPAALTWVVDHSLKAAGFKERLVRSTTTTVPTTAPATTTSAGPTSTSGPEATSSTVPTASTTTGTVAPQN